MTKLGKLIASNVQNAISKKDREADAISSSVRWSVLAEAQDDMSPVEMAEGDSVAYYLARTFEEVANKIKDIRFESNNAFSYGNVNITNVTTDETNTTKVTVVQTFDITPTRETKSEVDSLIAKFRALAIPPKFAKFINVSSSAGEDGSSVDLTIVFNLPEVYIQVIGAEDYLKRNNVVTKEIKKLIETYLG